MDARSYADLQDLCNLNKKSTHSIAFIHLVGNFNYKLDVKRGIDDAGWVIKSAHVQLGTVYCYRVSLETCKWTKLVSRTPKEPNKKNTQHQRQAKIDWRIN